MTKWFRFYHEALNDPKVQKLDGEAFKGWVNILCLAAQNDGKLPPIADVAFALRVTENAAGTLIERLSNGGLIDRLNGGRNGVTYAPHGWSERQYKSDTSSERVKRYRQRSKTVTETAPDTDTETDNSLAKAKGASADPDKAFWATGKAYLAEAGVSDPGKMIGMWCRDYGQVDTARAITEAQLARAVEPVSYVQRILKGSKKSDDMAGFIC